MVKLVENTEETVHAKKLLDELRSEVREALSGFEQIGDDELYDCIEQAVAGVAERQYLPLGQRIDLKNRLFDSFRRLDILQELVDDPEVTEIMVNGKDHIFVERSGRLERWNRSFEQVEQLEDMIQQIVSKINRVVNVSRPIADARLVEDGSRVHIVLPPIALDGPVVTIRKFPEPITIDRLIRYGSLTREAADFLEKLVRSGYNIFISGGTGSGKTTFLNALSAYIPETERVITIEDSAELQITQIPNLVRLETRGANAEGEGAVEISDLIRASLRMQALNTGHFGLSTGHGNSARDMLSRLETMTLMAADIPLTAVRGQIASAIDILVHLGRLRDRSRRVLEITEVTGYAEGEIQLNPLYRFEERGDADEDRSPGGAKQGVRGSLTAVGTLARQEKLHAAGYSL